METKQAAVTAVTAKQVEDGMFNNGIERVEHHECSICSYPCAYLRRGFRLYFDAGCWCTGPKEPQHREYQDAADWINMQTNEEFRTKLLKAFGIYTLAGTGYDDARSDKLSEQILATMPKPLHDHSLGIALCPHCSPTIGKASE